MFILNSNEPIKVAHLKKLANQSMSNDALFIEMVNNSFNETCVGANLCWSLFLTKLQA